MMLKPAGQAPEDRGRVLPVRAIIQGLASRDQPLAPGPALQQGVGPYDDFGCAPAPFPNMPAIMACASSCTACRCSSLLKLSA